MDHGNFHHRIGLYLWSKGRPQGLSGKAPKFESKCPYPNQKKRFLEKRLFFSFFCSFFFPGLFVSCRPSLLSVLCLSHLLSMPQTWHTSMPSPCPHPSTHVFTCTNPVVHTVLPPPKLTFFVFCPTFSRPRRPRRHCLCQDCVQRVLE